MMIAHHGAKEYDLLVEQLKDMGVRHDWEPHQNWAVRMRMLQEGYRVDGQARPMEFALDAVEVAHEVFAQFGAFE